MEKIINMARQKEEKVINFNHSLSVKSSLIFFKTYSSLPWAIYYCYPLVSTVVLPLSPVFGSFSLRLHLYIIDVVL